MKSFLENLQGYAMLNLSGSGTRRRPVNLGRRPAVGTQEILNRSRRERERRAEERARELSTIIIQRYIRRYATVRFILFRLIQEEKYHGPVVLIFGPRLTKYLDDNAVYHILKSTQEYLRCCNGKFVNDRICEIIVSLQGTHQCLVTPLLKLINLQTPNTAHFLRSLKCHLNAGGVLEGECGQAASLILNEWHAQDELVLTEFWEIDAFTLNGPNEKILEFYIMISNLGIIPKHIETINNAGALANMCRAYSLTHNQKLATSIAFCLTMDNIDALNGLENKDFMRALYEKPFIHSLVHMARKLDLPEVDICNIMTLISVAPSEILKNTVIVILLGYKDFFQELYAYLFELKFDMQNKTVLACFSVFTQIMEMYLLISMDHELFSDNAIITLTQLVKFTNYLKDFVFNNFWELEANQRSRLLPDALKLLLRIYRRESKLEFCRNQEGPKYWSSDNSEFLKVNIYKILQEYEDLYRQFMEEKVDIYSGSDDDESLSKLEELNNLKYSILDKLRNKNALQFKRQLRKLEILLDAPFLIPFEERVDLFYMLIALDKQRLLLDSDHEILDMLMPWNPSGMSSRQSAVISRESVLEDAFNAFNAIGERLKAKLAVTFVNEFGREAGIDGGGITKEFLTSVTEEGFSEERYGLFEHNDNYELYPKSHLSSQELKYMFFLGKVIGKCLYDRVLVDVTFAEFFLKKLLNFGQRFASGFDDLQSMDFALYSNLAKLLNMTDEELRSLDLTFEVSDYNPVDKTVYTVELFKGGKHETVNKANVLLYVMKISDFKLNRSLFKAVYAFYTGFSLIIAPHWVWLFDSKELQMLISGEGKDIDLKNLRENTEYGGFEGNDLTVKLFWEILEEFTSEERLSFLKFVTSVPQAPLQGFQVLEPKFGIKNDGPDVDRLPTASTCVNLLKLPDYRDKELLRQKLLYAINAGARFDLS